MDDEQRKDENLEGQEPGAAGPVSDGDSPAEPENSPSSPPAAEAAEPEVQADSAEGASSEQDETAEEPSEESVAEAEAPEEVEETPEPEPKSEEKKKDVIPGADLEPILVEPEGPELSAEEQARLEAEEEEKARREAELQEVETVATSREPAKIDKGARFLSTGKRKSAIARVTLLPGDGKIEINKRSLEEFFPRPLHQTMVKQPLLVSGYEGNVDVRVRVHGGGISGQAGAIRHGVARALIEVDSELRGDLKRRGFLTRDARVKERRKAGLKKARKRPQFSKR
jgi:small subunit ribosomal protein S9